MPGDREIVELTDPNILYQGRWYYDPVHEVVGTNWSSSTLSFVTTSGFAALSISDRSVSLDATQRNNKVLGWRVWERNETGGWDEIVKMGGITLGQFKREGEVWLFQTRPLGRERKVLVGSLDCFTMVVLDFIYVEDTSELRPLAEASNIPSVRMLVAGSSAAVGYSKAYENSDPTIDHIPRFGAWDGFPYLAQDILNDSVEENKTYLISQVIGYPERGLCKANKRGMGEMFWNHSPWDPNNTWSLDVQKRTALNNISNYGPTVILVALGTVDLLQGVPRSQFIQTLSQFIHRLCKEFSETLKDIVLVPPLPASEEAPKSVSEAAQEWSVQVEELSKRRLEYENSVIENGRAEGPRIRYWDLWKVLQSEDLEEGHKLTSSGQHKVASELARQVLKLQEEDEGGK